MNKFGPHIQRPGEGLDLIQRWQPRAALLMDVDGDFLRQVKEVSPKTFTIVRKWEGDTGGWLSIDPIVWADEIWNLVKSYPPDAVVYFNEPLSHDAVDQFPEFDARQEQFILRMREYGIEAVGFSFGEGNFVKDGPNIVECFPKSVKVLKYIALHEYGWPSMFDKEGWPGMEGYHTMRWPYILKDLEEAGYVDKQIILTEIGLTQAVIEGRPNVGWQSYADGVTDESYIRDSTEYHRRICQNKRIVAALPFNWYGYSNWKTFEHTSRENVVQAITTMDHPGPENGGESKVRVFDRDGNELTGSAAEEMVAYYGLSIEEPLGLQNGDYYFNVVALREKTGDTSFIFRVCNEDGNRRPNQECAWWWPNMPDDDNDIADIYDTDWHDEADLGITNENGEMGPSMGTGAYHDPNTPGPHEAWVRDPNIPSVLLDGIGMIGNTNHDHMDAEWQLEQYQGGGNGHAARLHEIADEIHSIANDLGPGGIEQITVDFKSGESQIFKPVSTVAALLRKLFRR